ncbi:MAG: hypothetical protein IJF18_06145 [Oscillospiraceae bacterium]|nr:hypothetical protein [Oscillospiraceae bacterium]
MVKYVYTLGAFGERIKVEELDRIVEYTYDSLYRLTGETITEGEVTDLELEKLAEPITVYNLEVEDFHTYFVGEYGVLVHNYIYDDFDTSKSPKNLVGTDYENFLTEQLGGNGSFKVGGREFDGGFGDIWWEAKSGNY